VNFLKVRIDEHDYTGAPVEILDQLRLEADQGIPDVGSYIRFVQDNVHRMTGQSCELDGGDVPRRAESLIHRLEALGALEILEV
jgi:hypothetical protein